MSGSVHLYLKSDGLYCMREKLEVTKCLPLPFSYTTNVTKKVYLIKVVLFQTSLHKIAFYKYFAYMGKDNKNKKGYAHLRIKILACCKI